MEGLLLHSQGPVTCPYHEAHNSSLSPISVLEDTLFYVYYPPISAWVFKVVSFLQISPPKALYSFPYLPRAPTRPSNSSLHDHADCI